MPTQTETLTEAQLKILEELRNGYVPRMTPSTPEELLKASADWKAGRLKTMSFEEVKAIADAFCD